MRGVREEQPAQAGRGATRRPLDDVGEMVDASRSCPVVLVQQFLKVTRNPARSSLASSYKCTRNSAKSSTEFLLQEFLWISEVLYVIVARN